MALMPNILRQALARGNFEYRVRRVPAKRETYEASLCSKFEPLAPLNRGGEGMTGYGNTPDSATDALAETMAAHMGSELA